jgi:hypothetical protein
MFGISLMGWRMDRYGEMENRKRRKEKEKEKSKEKAKTMEGGLPEMPIQTRAIHRRQGM